MSRFKSGLRKDKYSINTKLLPRVEENTIAAANCDSAQENNLLIMRETWTFGMFGACESTWAAAVSFTASAPETTAESEP